MHIKTSILFIHSNVFNCTKGVSYAHKCKNVVYKTSETKPFEVPTKRLIFDVLVLPK